MSDKQKQELETRPNFVTIDHLEYLDDLRLSGVTNMYGAGQYIEQAFGLDKRVAADILQYWMKTFSDRTKVSV